MKSKRLWVEAIMCLMTLMRMTLWVVSNLEIFVGNHFQKLLVNMAPQLARVVGFCGCDGNCFYFSLVVVMKCGLNDMFLYFLVLVKQNLTHWN